MRDWARAHCIYINYVNYPNKPQQLIVSVSINVDISPISRDAVKRVHAALRDLAYRFSAPRSLLYIRAKCRFEKRTKWIIDETVAVVVMPTVYRWYRRRILFTYIGLRLSRVGRENVIIFNTVATLNYNPKAWKEGVWSMKTNSFEMISLYEWFFFFFFKLV